MILFGRVGGGFKSCLGFLELMIVYASYGNGAMMLVDRMPLEKPLVIKNGVFICGLLIGRKAND